MLDVPIYYDRALYQMKLKRVFSRSWILLGHSVFFSKHP